MVSGKIRKREMQKYLEACSSIMGKCSDGIGGRVIDLLAVFALLVGTTTIFSFVTLLMADIIDVISHVDGRRCITTIIMLLIARVVYAYALLHGFKGIISWREPAFIYSLYWRSL